MEEHFFMELANGQLKKILVVDDEPDINTIAKLSLETFGKYSVDTCHSGVAALEKAETVQPQLILMDIMMPQLDGPETLRRLRANPKTKSIPVVFVTAKILHRETQQYKTLGALDVIAKPFDPMGLADKVGTIWKEHSSKSVTEDTIKSKLDEMKADFLQQYPSKISQIKSLWASYLESKTYDALSEFHQPLHKLNGLSGTLGLELISQTLIKIEAIVQAAVDGAGFISPADQTTISTLLVRAGQLGGHRHQSAIARTTPTAN